MRKRSVIPFIAQSYGDDVRILEHRGYIRLAYGRGLSLIEPTCRKIYCAHHARIPLRILRSRNGKWSIWCPPLDTVTALGMVQ
jgi:hypothetical protein